MWKGNGVRLDSRGRTNASQVLFSESYDVSKHKISAPHRLHFGVLRAWVDMGHVVALQQELNTMHFSSITPSPPPHPHRWQTRHETDSPQ